MTLKDYIKSKEYNMELRRDMDAFWRMWIKGAAERLDKKIIALIPDGKSDSQDASSDPVEL